MEQSQEIKELMREYGKMQPDKNVG